MASKTARPLTAPLGGDRMSPSERLFPDDLAPAGQQFFIGTRWRVDVFCDCGTDRDPDASVLVKSHEWISTPTAEAAIESVRAWGYTDAVRYVAERVEEVPR